MPIRTRLGRLNYPTERQSLPATPLFSFFWMGQRGTQMLTQERLKELLDYDPKSGIFVWKVNARKAAEIELHPYREA